MGGACAEATSFSRCTWPKRTGKIYRTDGAGDLAPVASAGTLSAVARRIVELEAISAEGITFLLHVHTGFRPDAETLDHLENRGKHAFYLVGRLTSE
jgi:hypothetical protein